MRHLSVLFLLAACSESKVGVYVQPPAVTIQNPVDGSSVDQAIPITLRGLITDAAYKDSLDQLEASWSVDGSPICEGSVVDLDGYADCTHTFTASGDVTLALQVTNPAGGSATATILLTLIPNTAPSIDILSPNGGASIYYSDYPITFTSEVSDNEDAPSTLVVGWDSDLDGALSVSGTPDTDGIQEGTGRLTAGGHTLTATVTDTTGLSTSTTTTLTVNGPNNEPDCEILTPTDSEVYEQGDPILFQGLASDVDVDTDMLTAVWVSDKDGTLSEQTPTSGGEVTFTSDLLTLTNHTISLTVTDEVGATCTDSVSIKVGSGPDLILESPKSGSWYNENESITFRAIVGDNQDAPGDLAMSWSSDLEGIFSTQGADSSGTATLTKALEIGTHVVTVSATDTDKLTSTASASVTVNDLPSAPSISISPNPPASDVSFSVSIDSPSLDAEGHTMAYRYTWQKNGSSSTYTAALIPASATQRGEIWEVTVTPNDGYGDGETATETATVGNAAPKMTSVSLSPDPAQEGDTLTCSPAATDNDGDSISYTYSWDVNSSTLTTTNSTLSSTSFIKGDEITCTATPSDGTDSGSSMTSSILTISNAVPSVASASLTPTTAYEASTLTCAAGATTDLDGDSVSISYSWTVSGATVSPTTSTLTGTYFDKADTVTCSVTPDDGTDSGTTVSSNTLTVQNTLPVVASASLTPTTGVKEASTLTCSAGSRSDDDPSDSVTVSYGWTIDGA
ncbi:MAG: hypothetical protein ACI8S6_001262, partial [Myxococcota bacterium]